MNRDLSSDLFKVREMFAAGERLDGLSKPALAPELQSRVERLVSETSQAVELDVVELLALALMFDPHSGLERARLGGVHVSHLMAKLCTNSVPVSERVTYVTGLVEKGLVLSDKYCGRLEEEVARHYGFSGIAHLREDRIQLSDFAVALILGDEVTLAHFLGAPYESNVEFMNDWAELLERSRNASAGGWQSFEDRVGAMVLAFRARQEYKRIMQRLDATNIRIPFRSLVQKYELSQAEQIVLMHCVYHRQVEDSAGQRLEDPMLLLSGEQFYALERPTLTANSRLVELGLFIVKKEPWGQEIRDVIKLSEDIYNLILGEAAWLAARPILE